VEAKNGIANLRIVVIPELVGVTVVGDVMLEAVQLKECVLRRDIAHDHAAIMQTVAKVVGRCRCSTVVRYSRRAGGPGGGEIS